MPTTNKDRDHYTVEVPPDGTYGIQISGRVYGPFRFDESHTDAVGRALRLHKLLLAMFGKLGVAETDEPPPPA